jgi:hypothetical protein
LLLVISGDLVYPGRVTQRRRAPAVAAIASAALLALGVGSYAWGSREATPDVDTIRDDAFFQNAALIERAWSLPVAASMRPGFVSQPNGSFCGPTSVVNVVRSLGGQASTEDVLEGTSITTVLGVLPQGITLDELAELTRTRLPNHSVEVVRDIDLPAFRELIATSANDASMRMIVNFTRQPLFATGGGHHSPIGGYLVDEDLVFVLDTNESYEPWLVPTDRLYGALDTIDVASGQKRGVLIVRTP